MRHAIIYLVSAVAMATAAFADEKLDAAVSAIAALGADQDKLAQYCAIVPRGPVDAAAGEEVDVKLEAFFNGLGSEYQALWALGDELADGSPEEAKLEAAFDELERKCK